MSRKLVRLSEEEKQKQENEDFLKGRPNRMEVMNYVNALLTDKYMPEIYSNIQIGIMMIQAILIEKGIVTGEEIEKITQEFLKRREEDKKTDINSENLEP